MTTTYTPMVQQYLDVKNKHQEELLFFRLGDFYELFFQDALTASKELNITLTGRAGGLEEKIPMCGVPYHAVDGYIAKLIRKGYRIAICEQVEDPKSAVGIVKREVIKIITPGTVLSSAILEDGHNQYLTCLREDGEALCVSFADISTGECQWYMARGSSRREFVLDQIFRLQPAELIAVGAIDEWEKITTTIKQKLPQCIFSKFVCDDHEDFFAKHFATDCDAYKNELARGTVEAMLQYIHDNVKADLAQINKLTVIARDSFMILDATAIRNLELVRNMRDGGKKGTLLDVLDYTNTAMGARRLRQWLEAPLLDLSQIKGRQEAIKALLENIKLRDGLTENLKSVTDLERILSRIEVGSANARDMVSLRASLQVLPNIKILLQDYSQGLLQKLSKHIGLHEGILATLETGIVDEPPFTLREGGMIRTGYDLELDELHDIAQNNKEWMQKFEQRIKDQSGIKTLKVGFNKVFGYYIEVSKGSVSLVPDYFIRKQTLVNAERYIVPELKEFENKILSAKEKIQQLEYYLFNKIREEIRGEIVEIQDTARALGSLDVLLSLSIAAFKNNYVCPELNNKQEISIRDGRHPVVEKLLQREMFVPNDTLLNSSEQRMIILTGPNMAGKSTYMRQVALLVLMTQMGSYIPARQASICPADRIFTRVGASDDLATGQSTFMVEMNEVSQILKYATKQSLIILDEVGRGTSTHDGMSIARAVVEFINEKLRAKTLFATHYHELIELEDLLEGVKNYSIAVKERGNDIVFLRRIVPGGTDRSYGIHVAQLAGLPKKVVARAEDLLLEYDGEKSIETKCLATKSNDEAVETSLFAGGLAQKLTEMDIMTMTPLEALNELYKLQEEARREGGNK
ncbi:MAG: DNA mismatch repair protein MutS [Acidaminococcaceae bacterium]|nr:DNA mismatch repair protein MutS [Acidaminococcaceae bacterium]